MVCQAFSYCSGIPCSEYGFCSYDIIDYFINNKTFNTTCQCSKGYFTRTGDQINCCYSRRNSFVAFIFELFFTFGAGHYYSKRYVVGALKTILEIILIVISVILHKKKYNSETNYLFVNIGINEHPIDFEKEPSKKKQILIYKSLNLICYCLMIYIVIDLIFICFNFYNDGNGIPLY